MYIDVRATNIDLDDDFFMEHERRTFFALGPFADAIQTVSVVLTDTNGPRGGDDIACRVIIQAVDGWTITVAGLEQTPARALGQTVRRIRHALTREITRRRQRTAY